MSDFLLGEDIQGQKTASGYRLEVNRKAAAFDWMEDNGGAIEYLPFGDDGPRWTVEPLALNPAFQGEGNTLLEAVEDAMEANK